MRREFRRSTVPPVANQYQQLQDYPEPAEREREMKNVREMEKERGRRREREGGERKREGGKVVECEAFGECPMQMA